MICRLFGGLRQYVEVNETLKIQQKKSFCIINAMFFDKTRQHFHKGIGDKNDRRNAKKVGAFHSTTCITKRCMGGTKSTEETETKQINLR